MELAVAAMAALVMAIGCLCVCVLVAPQRHTHLPIHPAHHRPTLNGLSIYLSIYLGIAAASPMILSDDRELGTTQKESELGHDDMCVQWGGQ